MEEELIREFPAGYKYIPTHLTCPRVVGLQAKENITRKKDNDGGWCVTWSVIIAYHRITNPEFSIAEVIDELMKKGKGGLVSFMTYPGEFHYFTREHVLRDAWHRVEDFWDANLAPRPQ